jgi:hypothetical protein
MFKSIVDEFTSILGFSAWFTFLNSSVCSSINKQFRNGCFAQLKQFTWIAWFDFLVQNKWKNDLRSGIESFHEPE